MTMRESQILFEHEGEAKMKTRKLGKSGLEVSPIGRCWLHHA